MKRRLSLLILLTLIVSACAEPIAPTSTPASMPTAILRSVQEEDIREAVFRYQFEHNASGLQQAAEFYCLSLGEVDVPIRRIMSCCYVSPSRVSIYEKRTHLLRSRSTCMR